MVSCLKEVLKDSFIVKGRVDMSEDGEIIMEL